MKSPRRPFLCWLGWHRWRNCGVNSPHLDACHRCGELRKKWNPLKGEAP